MERASGLERSCILSLSHDETAATAHIHVATRVHVMATQTTTCKHLYS